MNKPSDPATVVAPYRISLTIDIDDPVDDQRRVEAENWCFWNTVHGWYRRILKRPGPVEFHFVDQNEAIMFRLSN